MRNDLRSTSARGSALRTRRFRRRPETGDTLIEVLLAVMVLGIASAAILLAFSTSIFGSSEYKALATTDTGLRGVAEAVTNDLQAQLQPLWTNCGGVIALNAAATQPGETVVPVPSGYTVSSVTATYWSSSQGRYVAQDASDLPPNPITCPGTADVNPSALVTITILSANGTSYSISDVVNDPTTPSQPPFGTASKLVFIGQPGNASVGNTLSAPPEVAVEDANNEIVTTDLSSVHLQLNGGASGAQLSSICSGAEIGGVVTFSNCDVNKPDAAGDGGYYLTASDTGLTSANSSAFYVSAGVPSQIEFSTSPAGGTGGSAGTGGTAWSPSNQPVVQVEDAFGNPVTNDMSSVSLSILPGTGAPGAQLSGCSTPTESSGAFSFTGCSINLDSPTSPSSPYQLVATDGTWTADSGQFTINTGLPAQLVFTTSPSAGTLAATFANQPVVAIADAGGNQVTTATSTPIALSLASGPGTLSCTATSKNTTAGAATFAGCKILTGTSGKYQLTASATYGGKSLPVVPSSIFTVAGTPYSLSFTTIPGASTTATAFTTQPVVDVVDSNGYVVTTSTASITLQNATSGSAAGSVTGCSPSPVTAVNGVATFSNCQITISGTVGGNYLLEATSTGIANGFASKTFPVAGTATKLAFTTLPGASTTGVAFTVQPTVQVEDAAGNLVTNSTATIALSVNSGPGTLGCPNSVGDSSVAIGGIASFSQCQISLSGTGGGAAFTLKAISGSLTSLPASSLTPFNVAGPATQLVFTTQPSNGTGGANFATQPQVTVEDANGLVVTADSSTVLLTLNPPSGSSALSGATVSDTCAGTESAGVVTFSGCSVNDVANGYTFTATDGSLAAATSSPFNITTGVAAQLAFTSSPLGGTAGQAFGVQPVVAVEDAGGNLVSTGSPRLISLTITGGAPLTCTSNYVTTSGGIASFAGCESNNAGSNVTLTATTPAFPGGRLSATFNISPGAASQLAITSSPAYGAATATPTLGPLTVQEEDAYGNPVLAGAGNETINLASTSTGSPTFSDLSGGASSPTVTIPYGLSSTTFYYGDETAGLPTVSVSAAGLSSSAEVQTIVPGPASQFVITSSPVSGGASATANLGPITVLEKDQFGNPAPASGSGQPVSLASTGTGTFSGTLGGSGATSVTIQPGATSVPFYFGDGTLSSNSTQTITVSATGFAPVTQNETITTGAVSASRSTVVASPTTGVAADGATTSTVTVTLVDAFGNPIANKAVTLTPGAGSSLVTTVLGTTNAIGVASFTVNDTVAQVVTYTAKDTTDNVTLSTTPSVTFVPGPASASAANSTVVASPTSVGANGTLTSTITVTVKDAHNNVRAGDPVTLTAGTGSSLITTLSGTTNASGQATFAVSDNTPQAVSYTAKDTVGNVTLAQTATVTFVSDPASATTSTAVASPATGVTANGTTTSTITVTIKDAGSSPVSNQVVTLAGTGSSVITTVSGTTNGLGVATFTVTDTHAQTVTYTATDTTQAITVGQQPTVAFVAGPASASVSTVVASATSPTVSNTASSTITVTAVDANSNPEIGDTITLTAGSGSSVITTVSGTTNASGVATFTVYDNHAQAVVYTAHDTTDSVQLNQTPTVTFLTGTASALVANSTVVASTTPVKANGISTSTITVTVNDAFNNPESGDTVTLTQGAGTSTITPASAIANASGVATFTVSTNAAQTDTYTAHDTTDSVQLNQTAAVTFSSDPVSGSSSTAVASQPTGVTANGTASSLITVTIKDASGSAIANQTVTLGQGGGASLITYGSNVTNNVGQVVFTVTNTTAQTVTYTATDTTASVTVGAPLPTVAFVAGPASPLVANSTVVASPTSVNANGTSFSTITVTSKDANNNPEMADTITLTAGSGSSVITTSPATTNSSGVATFNVADNTAQPVVYTATDTTDSITFNQTPTVTFTADSASTSNSTASANPTTGVTANGSTSSLVTVTIKDTTTAPGLPIANQTVTLTGTGASVVTPISNVTNSSGVATFSVTDTTAQTVTLTAKDTTQNVTVAQAPTVAFVAGPVSISASTVVASPTSLTADGATTSTVTVTARDANNNPVSGKTMTLTDAPTTGSTITTVSGVTNASGVATFTVKGTTAQSVVYTAHDTTDTLTLNQTPTVTFVAGLASGLVAHSTVTPSSTSVLANGTSSSTISVLVRDVNNNPEIGDAVTLTAGSGTSVITTSPATTNSSGVATFTVADNTAQAVTYSAKDTTDNVSIAQNTTVTFTSDSASAGLSTVSPNATTGAFSYTITVTINDVNGPGLPVANQTVTLTPSAGGSTITPVSGTTTNSSGQVQFTVADPTFNQQITYTAKDTTGTAVTVTQTATVKYT